MCCWTPSATNLRRFRSWSATFWESVVCSPSVVETQDQQMGRELALMRGKLSPIEKYQHLMALVDRNERLFYHVVANNVEEMVPLVYTPVVGEACVKYSNLMVHPKGLFLSLSDVGRVDEIFKNYLKLHPSVKAIVVTDGERILGLGDQGCNGMGIPVGKLQLYVAMGGIHPSETLPVTLDVGTNNQSLLQDTHYVGLKQKRERGAKFSALVDEFVHGVRDNFGSNCLIQWEDFGNTTAFEILDKYRDEQLSFNDDIQGTASVTLAGVMSSLRLSKGTRNGAAKLRDHKFVFLGAGEAGVGIAELIADSVAREENIPKAEARRNIFLVDSQGLVCADRGDGAKLQHHKIPFAHQLPKSMVDELKGDWANLEKICKLTGATALIGVSAQPNTFTKQVCEQMASNCERPLIFALSNPTDKAECTAEQAIQWTNAQCMFCSGSPFDNVQYQGKSIKIGQANNAYIFPGLALGVIAGKVKSIPDELLEVAANSLASQVSPNDLQQGSLFPPLSDIRKVSARIAADVLAKSYDLGLAELQPRPADLEEYCRLQMYSPKY
ncbi:hypothetical protein BASA81_001074 [Batrachochytrium salamandrivorans]|nr:hypothetical protein BASA81_001074 [Batrachochytrium salamandrivorans]